MIISSVVIAGALSGGILGTSVKVYRENKRKKETPWTMYAEKIAKKKRKSAITDGTLAFARRRERGKGMMVAVASSAQIIPQKMRAILPFSNDLRRQHLQEIASSDEALEMSQVEKAALRRIKIAGMACILTGIGVSIHPLSLLLAAPLLGYTFIYNYRDGYQALRKEHKIKPDLISSFSSTALLLDGMFFPASAMAAVSSLIRYLVIKSEDHSKKSLVSLFGELPRSVWILKEGVEIQIPLEAVQTGDMMVIDIGQTIPVDGVIVSGMASIDQHMLTGEAQPVEREPGDSVLAATIVLSGRIVVRIENTGQETVAAQIGHVLNKTTDYRDVVKLRADEYSAQMIMPMLAISCMSLPFGGLGSFSGLLMSIPAYKMRYLAPASLLNYLNIAAREGILVKDGRSLELIMEVDTLVFDKTGTLTLEQPHVSRIYSCSALSEDELLTITATAEHRQSHPIAQAILAAANERQLALFSVDDAHYEIGYGIQVRINGQRVLVGSERFMEMKGIVILDEIQTQQEISLRQGHTIVMVAINDELAGIIELRPTVRPEAKQIIERLRQRNLDMVIISGDREEPTQHLAQELGIERYFAQVLPEDKAKLVEQLESEGRSVCFVGDGINDAIALKKATVSISLRGATSAATDTAQIVLMDANLTQLGQLFEIAQEFDRNINRCLTLTTVPMWFCIGGIILLGWGPVTAFVLNTSVMCATASTYVLWPLFRHATRKSEGNSEQ